MEVAIKNQETTKYIGRKQNSCPLCNKSDLVGNVISARVTGGAVVHRKFCRRCLVEFEKNGSLVPPLY